MDRAFFRPLFTATLALAVAGPLAAADDPVREKAIKLNSTTGTSAMAARLTELIKDEAGTKNFTCRQDGERRETEPAQLQCFIPPNLAAKTLIRRWSLSRLRRCDQTRQCQQDNRRSTAWSISTTRSKI
jgi:hypothetical protein